MHWALPVGYGSYFFFFFLVFRSVGAPACVLCWSLGFWYLVFLPLAIFGRSFFNRLTSPSVHECTRNLPNWITLGDGTFFASIYRLNVLGLIPSLLATWVVVNIQP